MTDPADRAKIWLALAAIAVAVLAAYANSLRGPFVFDDASSIIANPTIRRLDFGALAPPDAAVTVQGRPILNFSLAVNYAISGTQVWSYHALNLAIHLCAALTLFGLVRRTAVRWSALPPTRFPDPRTPSNQRVEVNAHHLALAATLLWALHPLQTESVTYVIQRAESLLGLFFLLTLYCFARATDCHPLDDNRSTPAQSENTEICHLMDDNQSAWVRWLWLGAAGLACALGTATKEVTAVAPLVVLLYDRTFVSGTWRDALRRHRWFYAGLASTWLLAAWLVFGGGGNRGGSFGGDVTPWAYWLTQFPAIVRYLALTFWPSPLVFEYGTFWIAHVTDIALEALLVLALLAVTFASLIVGRGRPTPPSGMITPSWRGQATPPYIRLAGFLGASFFLILAPTSLMPGTTQMIVEHRMYLPLAALVVGVVCAVQQWLGARALFAWLPVALGLGVATAMRNEDYRSEITLWRDTVGKRPDNPLARQLLAAALEQAGDTTGALTHYEAALRLKPNFALTHDTLGQLLFRLGRRDEAAAHFETALRLQPAFADAHDHLGAVFANQRRWPEAIAHHEAALRAKPDFPDAHFNLANALTAAGRAADAARHYEVALRLRADFPAAHYNYANLLAETGRPADAVPHYQAAVRLKPDHADAYNNLGGAFIDLGRLPEAAAAYEAALRINPGLAHTRENLARLRAAIK
ncbi:MAG: tetratricopeptide repeat protein [Verrucomicrobia bacterium]|nr:tetratricopeptide repeat protein [Verrucomicrobiota bacterium]